MRELNITYMSEKMKYVKVGHYDSIVIFPTIIEHSDFKYLNPKSAGFCYISTDEISCFGESISLGIKSDPIEDSKKATLQYFGVEAMLNLKL